MRIPKGCPLCGGDVFGTESVGYYCRSCNLLFRKRHLNLRHLRRATKRLIQKHFSSLPAEEDPAKERVELEPLPEVVDKEFLDRVAAAIERHVAALKAATPSLEVAKEQLEWPVLGGAKQRRKKKRTTQPKRTTQSSKKSQTKGATDSKKRAKKAPQKVSTEKKAKNVVQKEGKRKKEGKRTKKSKSAHHRTKQERSSGGLETRL